MPSDGLPRPLQVEATLAVLAAALGPIPWLVLDATVIRPPPGMQTVWLVAALALVCLWFVLLGHLVVDGVGLLRDGPGHLAERGSVHVGFRVVESLGVVAAPVSFQVVASQVAGDPPASGAAAFGGLFVIMGVLAANAVVVLLHAGWLLGTAYVAGSGSGATA